jgi:hypothetical protein
VGEYSPIFLEEILSNLIRMNHIQQGFAPFSGDTSVSMVLISTLKSPAKITGNDCFSESFEMYVRMLLNWFIFSSNPVLCIPCQEIQINVTIGKSLAMSDIKPLTLTSETGVTEVLSLFDLDPVVSMMSTETENKDTAKTQSGEVEDKYKHLRFIILLTNL